MRLHWSADGPTHVCAGQIPTGSRNPTTSREGTSRTARLTGLVTACLLLGGAVTYPAPAASAQAEPSAPLAQLDGFLAELMAERRVPGAVFTLVLDGEPVLSQGYGVIDVDTERPVDPDTTCFHLGSITKSLTAAAIAQSIAAGDLDPQVDVNTYLDRVEVPSATLHELLTHTAGYEHRIIHSGVADAAEYQPLEEYLRDQPPRRVAEPGQYLIYSSIGYAVAGLAAAHQAGTDYASYLRHVLLDPLGMERTHLPTPDRPARGCATGYRVTRDEVTRYPAYYSLIGPGGDAVSTATDMGRFLAALLNPEAAGLDPAGVAYNLDRQFGYPYSRGRSYGFVEGYAGGHRAVYQDGMAPGYLSRVYLLPTEGLGFFLAHTSGTDLELARIVTDRVLELLTEPGSPPAAPPRPQNSTPDGHPTATAVDQARRSEELAGLYHDLALPWFSFLALPLTLLNQNALRITATSDGDTLIVNGVEYQRISEDPIVYRSADPDGEPLVFVDDYVMRGAWTWHRVGWWRTPVTQAAVSGGFLLALLTNLALAVLRRPRGPALPRWTLGSASASALLFAIGFGYLAATSYQDTNLTVYPMPGGIRLILAVPLGALGLTAVAAGATLHSWRRSGRLARAVNVAGCATLVAWSGYLASWNLLGWHI